MKVFTIQMMSRTMQRDPSTANTDTSILQNKTCIASANATFTKKYLMELTEVEMLQKETLVLQIMLLVNFHPSSCLLNTRVNNTRRLHLLLMLRCDTQRVLLLQSH